MTLKCSFCEENQQDNEKLVLVSRDRKTNICCACADRARILLQEHAEKVAVYDGLHKRG